MAQERLAVVHDDNSVSLSFGINDRLNEKKTLKDFVSGMSGARWQKSTRTWELPDIYDYRPGTLTKAGFTIVDETGGLLKRAKRPPRPEPQFIKAEIPDDLSEFLYDYQREGAVLIAEGRRLLLDEPGVGKTLQSLTTASLLGSQRTLVVCPPVVVTHWSRTASDKRLNLGPVMAIRDTGFSTPIKGAVSATPLKLKNGKMQLPERGVVIVSTSLLSLQNDLHQMMLEWSPTVFIIDEAHSCKTWSSLRARRMRAIAYVCPNNIPQTGTPAPAASALEYAPLLDMTGDLQRIWGDYETFRDYFCYQTKFGWRTRKGKLEELRKILDELSVRRTKAEVLPGLPPKVRNPYWVDAINKDYKDALKDVYAEIDAWLKTVGWDPTDEEISEWAGTKIGMISRLREAAGLAKVAAAAEFVADRPQKPMLVWGHHHSVLEKLRDTIPGAELIYGLTTDKERDRLVDLYEAGEIPVLVCSIQKVGVGVTLVRGNEALFVESDWTPDNITQAEDRQHRPGQEAEHVIYTTMICAGTVDETVQSVLTDKVERLNILVSGDHAVNTEMVTSGNVLVKMVEERVNEHWGRTPEPKEPAEEPIDYEESIDEMDEASVRESAESKVGLDLALIVHGDADW